MSDDRRRTVVAVVATFPAFALLVAAALGDERIAGKVLGGVVLVMVGVTVVSAAAGYASVELRPRFVPRERHCRLGSDCFGIGPAGIRTGDAAMRARHRTAGPGPGPVVPS